MKTNSDTRWLRLTDRNAGGNYWYLAMPELWFVGAATIWMALASLLSLFK